MCVCVCVLYMYVWKFNDNYKKLIIIVSYKKYRNYIEEIPSDNFKKSSIKIFVIHKLQNNNYSKIH